LLLYEPKYPIYDIIFIHGMGDRVSTWKNASGSLWMKEWIPDDFKRSRIWTYGYNWRLFGAGNGLGNYRFFFVFLFLRV